MAKAIFIMHCNSHGPTLEEALQRGCESCRRQLAHTGRPGPPPKAERDACAQKGKRSMGGNQDSEAREGSCDDVQKTLLCDMQSVLIHAMIRQLAPAIPADPDMLNAWGPQGGNVKVHPPPTSATHHAGPPQEALPKACPMQAAPSSTACAARTQR